jgi:hypothetical protein
MISQRRGSEPETVNTKDMPMTEKPERKDAKKDAKEPRSIIHLGMMGDGTEEQTSGSAVILRSASRKTRLMRLSTSQPQGRNPDLRVR